MVIAEATVDILQISHYARILPTGPDCIYWMTESKQGFWPFPHLGKVATLLASSSTATAVLEQFAAGADRDRAAQALDEMIRRGLVESTSLEPPLAQLCRESGVSPQELERKRWVKGATIVNLATAAEDEPLRFALSALGVPVGDAGKLRVVAVTDYLDPRLEGLEDEWREAEVPWVLTKLSGEEIWVGPIFVPGRTACWRCLQPKLRENAWLRSQLAPRGGLLCNSYVSESRLRVGAEFAAQEIGRWLIETPGSLEGVIWSFSWATLRSERHQVVQRPDCPGCHLAFLPGRGRPTEPESVSASWKPPAELRTLSAQAVIDRLEPLASPITGILRRLERRDLAPSPLIFTYGAVYNVALPPEPLRISGGILQPGVCSGRGWTADEAKAACLAEAAERYSTQFRGDEDRVSARYHDLGAAAIHPERLLLFSEQQYANREDWNRVHNQDEAVPERFDETEQIEWAEGWSLTAHEKRYLPTALCSQYYRPAGKRWIGDADSSGCAAGGRVEEAILCGILELVERDALAIWWFNRIPRPAFSPNAIPDSLCRAAAAQMQVQGWDVWLLDIATDLDIPVFAAVASQQGHWIRGAGCHLHPAVAIRQAVCELWQLSKASSRPGSPPPYSSMDESSLLVESLEERNVDLKSPIEDCCGKLARAGQDIAIFDLTRPEIQFPVVRVVAPGLRSRKPRFAPGRLYDVPIRLGWLRAPRDEQEFPTQSA